MHVRKQFFSQNPETVDGAVGESLGKKLFVLRST